MYKRSIKLFSLLIIMFISFSLIACHGYGKQHFHSKNYFVVPEEFDETKEIELTFWAKNDSFKEQKEAYNDAITRFQEIYPNVKVNIKNYTDYTAIYNDVITNISTNTTPNICITYPDYVATYLEGENVMVSLDGLISDSNYGLGGSKLKFAGVTRDDIIDKFMDELVIDNEQYAIPFMRSSEACYVNKTYIESLGFTLPKDFLTWDFVWEVCNKAMEEYGYAPNKNFKPLIYKSSDNMFIQMAWQRGIPYSNDNGDILLFNDKASELLKEIQGYCEKGYLDTFKHCGYPGNFFNRGNCIFAIDSTAGATWLGTNAPNIDIHSSQVANFETEIYPVPQSDIANPKMISQGPSICIFYKEDPQVVLASWLFTQFLLNDETQIRYAKTEGYIPVTYSAINNSSYQEYINNPIVVPKTNAEKEQYYIKLKASSLVYNNRDNTFITPVFNGSSLVRSAAGALIDDTCLDVFKKTSSSSDEYFEALYAKISTLYKITQSDKTEGLGKLPKESLFLIIGLAVVWAGIGTYFAIKFYKSKKN